MGSPEQSVALTTEHVAELHGHLGRMRHNVNNHLALIIAAAELLRRKPEMSARVIETLSTQPDKIVEELQKFAAQFEAVFGPRPR
jgi:hypothetical protein